MESRYAHTALLIAAIASMAASHRTKHFVVRASTPELAEEIATKAEQLWASLAVEWTGQPLPSFPQPCLITVEISPQLKSSGLTNVRFGRRGLAGAHISLQGSRERVLRSVLPHELTHLVFASHLGPLVPRWADEGASITVEDLSEQTAQHDLLLRLVENRRTLSLSRLFSLRDYPADAVIVYTQGYSVTKFLVEQGGQRKFTRYLADGLRWQDWDRATEKHYGCEDLSQLQHKWEDWVRDGQLAAKSAAPVRSVSAPVSQEAVAGQ